MILIFINRINSLLKKIEIEIESRAGIKRKPAAKLLY